MFEDAEYAAGLAAPGSTCFVLTNTRSLPEDAAVELNTSVATSLFTLGVTWQLRQQQREARIQALQKKADRSEGEIRRRQEARIAELRRDYAESKALR